MFPRLPLLLLCALFAVVGCNGDGDTTPADTDLDPSGDRDDTPAEGDDAPAGDEDEAADVEPEPDAPAIVKAACDTVFAGANPAAAQPSFVVLEYCQEGAGVEPLCGVADAADCRKAYFAQTWEFVAESLGEHLSCYRRQGGPCQAQPPQTVPTIRELCRSALTARAAPAGRADACVKLRNLVTNGCGDQGSPERTAAARAADWCDAYYAVTADDVWARIAANIAAVRTCADISPALEASCHWQAIRE